MSSLAASRADNFYIDPAHFDPSKRRGSANAIAGSHPLGVRANKLKSEGILVIRFEMPFDSWCDGCGEHVARGIRFNADKKQDGSYHSTRIYRFTMKCPFCPQKFEIRTDPKNADYEYLSGLRKKARPERGHSETTKGKTNEQALALINDAFFKLEHVGDDKRKAAGANERLRALADIQEARYADDYASNSALRAAARVQRHTAADLVAESKKLRFSGALLPRIADDATAAASAIAVRDLERLEHGILRYSHASSSGGGAKSQRQLTDTPLPCLLDSVTAPLTTAAAFAPLPDTTAPRIPIGVVNPPLLKAHVPPATGRLSAIQASYTGVVSQSLLPAGRAAQILGSSLTMCAFKRATTPAMGSTAAKATISSHSAVHTQLAGQKRTR